MANALPASSMVHYCPHCLSDPETSEARAPIRTGFFKRKSDRKLIQRFKCFTCRRTFSSASFDPCFRQHKRQFNQKIFELFASTSSQRRMAYLLRLNRKTIKRKFLFLGLRAGEQLRLFNRNFAPAETIEFDDLETFEHTKCKPLSVTLAVEAQTRRILGFAVSRMPAKGTLAHIARKKYGPRLDERPQGRAKLFTQLQDLVHANAVIRSDQNPHYPADVAKFFPQALHLTVKGKRGAISGQGELKKVKFDPLFSLNHTCAQLRADMSRLIRRTWCTTKLVQGLELHLAIAALYHNQHLLLPKRV